MNARLIHPLASPGDRIANVVSLALSHAAAAAEIEALAEGGLSRGDSGEADAATDRMIFAADALVREAIALGRSMGLLDAVGEDERAVLAIQYAILWEANVLRDPLTESESAEFAAFVGLNWRRFFPGESLNQDAPDAWRACYAAWRATTPSELEATA